MHTCTEIAGREANIQCAQEAQVQTHERDKIVGHGSTCIVLNSIVLNSIVLNSIVLKKQTASAK
jgi:hypothetical protein